MVLGLLHIRAAYPQHAGVSLCVPHHGSRPQVPLCPQVPAIPVAAKTPKGRRFDVELPGDGVYEVGIKRWNADKTLLLERQVYWLLLLDGNEYTIPKWQVLPLVEALRSGTLGA